jgi:NADH dehydrogenase
VAPGLKKIDDATSIRRRILTAFENAESTDDAEARRRFLTFVVIGGGPTGVEMAGAIAELARVVLRHDFRRIDPTEARIVLVESGPRLLSAFPPKLSEAAQASLKKLGVDVRLGAPVTQCDFGGVAIGNQRLEAATVVWGAGVMASGAAHWLDTKKDRIGRVMVEPNLSVPGNPEIFIIGDTAHVQGPNGLPLPGLAPVAKQQGAYVARVLRAQLAANPAPPPFQYRSWGTMATIGRRAAVADLGWVRLSGTLAWLLWGLVHISFLIGFRNRVRSCPETWCS